MSNGEMFYIDIFEDLTLWTYLKKLKKQMLPQLQFMWIIRVSETIDKIWTTGLLTFNRSDMSSW